MAGSWNHMTDESGALLRPELFLQMIENVGDAYEAAEESYGMVLWLAQQLSEQIGTPRADLVEQARQSYREGIALGARS